MSTEKLKACPCHHTTPCQPRCTCVTGGSSFGCLRCCTYGSPEQQRGKAEKIARWIDYGRSAATRPAEDARFNPKFDLDDELRWILGRPGFAVRDIAHLLRDSGYQCARKCEDEQAVAIHWMLCKYFDHGLKWREEGEKELKRLAAIQEEKR